MYISFTVVDSTARYSLHPIMNRNQGKPVTFWVMTWLDKMVSCDYKQYVVQLDTVCKSMSVVLDRIDRFSWISEYLTHR